MLASVLIGRGSIGGSCRSAPTTTRKVWCPTSRTQSVPIAGCDSHPKQVQGPVLPSIAVSSSNSTPRSSLPCQPPCLSSPPKSATQRTRLAPLDQPRVVYLSITRSLHARSEEQPY